MASNSFDDELKPDAEANRIISDSDLIHIDIKELNKMLKERGIAKVSDSVWNFTYVIFKILFRGICVVALLNFIFTDKKLKKLVG